MSVHTLIIAETQRVAEEVSVDRCVEAHAPNRIHYNIYRPGFPPHEAVRLGYLGVSASHPVVRAIQGRRLVEIVIVGDWLRWHLPDGHWSQLWHLIRRHRAMGGKVTWL